MIRLIYDTETKQVIDKVNPCEGTVTATPYVVFEGTEQEVAAKISELSLTDPYSNEAN